MKILRLTLIIAVFTCLQLSLLHSQSSAVEPIRAKYVFLFIGDGMGLAEVNLTEGYRAAIQGKIGFDHLNFTKLPNVGLVSNHAYNQLITCSAASATALASGFKTNIGRIGMDPAGQKPYVSIAEKAKEAGFKIGIVTSVSIDHATPAAFYAHQPERDMYFEIGMQLPKSNFDFFASGGFIDEEGEYEGKTINLLTYAREAGYQVVETKTGFDALKPGSGKTIVFSPRVASEFSLPYAIDKNPGDITLADFTAKAIEMLYDEKGFFLMVEGGKIDWAGHVNDAATLIHEVQEFDDAVGKALEFYQEHPDETLIIVTADHETGGLALGNRGTGYDSRLDLLKYQKSSAESMIEIIWDFRATKTSDTLAEFNRMLRVLESEIGLNSRMHETLLDSAEKSNLLMVFKPSIYGLHNDAGLYGEIDPFISGAVRIMNEKSGISWGSGSHTAINVPVYATGVGGELFSGYIDNTDFPRFIGKLMGVQ